MKFPINHWINIWRLCLRIDCYHIQGPDSCIYERYPIALILSNRAFQACFCKSNRCRPLQWLLLPWAKEWLPSDISGIPACALPPSVAPLWPIGQSLITDKFLGAFWLWSAALYSAALFSIHEKAVSLHSKAVEWLASCYQGIRDYSPKRSRQAAWGCHLIKWGPFHGTLFPSEL